MRARSWRRHCTGCVTESSKGECSPNHASKTLTGDYSSIFIHNLHAYNVIGNTAPACWMSVWPVYNTFSTRHRHHNGYVTCSQFRQCLSYLGLSASDQEMRFMEIRLHYSAVQVYKTWMIYYPVIQHIHIYSTCCVAQIYDVTATFTLNVRFGDSKGVNYLQFLEELQPPEKLEDKYQTRMKQLSTRDTPVCVKHNLWCSVCVALPQLICPPFISADCYWSSGRRRRSGNGCWFCFGENQN